MKPIYVTTMANLSDLGCQCEVIGACTPMREGTYYDPPEPEDIEVTKITIGGVEVDWDGLTERDQGAIESAMREASGDGPDPDDARDNCNCNDGE